MMKMLRVLPLLVMMGLNLTGCAVDRAPSAGFVESSKLYEDPNLPFQQVWKAPDFDKSKYSQLYVAEVNTKYMLAETDWQEKSRKSELSEDIKQVATYTRESIKKAFREDQKQSLRIINIPTRQPGTLNLEIALVEVVPSKVVLNALGYAPFGIGLAIKGVRMMAKDQSSVAIEARIVDASTGKVVAMIADRKVEQSALISAKGFTWYSHAYNIIDAWSKELVAIANRKPNEKVEGMSRFTLKPW